MAQTDWHSKKLVRREQRLNTFQSNSVTGTFALEKQTLSLASTISKSQILYFLKRLFLYFSVYKPN